jgi:hypothetical protein
MATALPYSPSWVDRFQDWLERLPIPVWLSVLLFYLLTALCFNAGTWIDGVSPPGTFSADLTFNALWGVTSLSFCILLDRASRQALDKFSVLVPNKKREIELLRYKMTTIPSRVAWVLTGLMVLLLGYAFFSDPATLYAGMESPISYLLTVPLAILSYAFAPLLIYQGARVLNSVRSAYSLLGEINLFELQPLYAFTAVTSISGFFWLLIMNMNILGNYVLAEGTETSILLSLLFASPLIPLALLSFLYPTWGIHRRIQSKKETSLRENGRQIERVHRTLYQHLSKGDHKKSSDLEKSLSSLYRMREQIEKIPTWPWNPGTFRNFLSAVFLPLGLWALQRFLANFLS